MAYNTKKGSQHTGDIQFEGDPDETQIDFENDSIKLKTGGFDRLEVNNNHVSASVNLSASAFYGDGSTLSGVAPASAMSSFIVSGNSGPVQTISDGNTLNISGGTGINAITSETDKITVSIANTAVSAGSYTYSSITVDSQGRLTAASNGSEPAVNTFNGYAENRVITAGETEGEIDGEANLTFNGTTLNLQGTGSITGSLEISGSGQSLIRLHTSDSDTLKEIVFLKDGNPAAAIQINDAEHLFIENENTKDIILRANNQNALRVIGSQRRVLVGNVSRTAANAQLDVEGNAIISGSLTATGIVTAQSDLSGTAGVHITGSDPHITIGARRGSAPNPIMLNVIPADGDGNNKILCLFQRTEASGQRTVLAATGSGQVAVGGSHLGGVFNVSGSEAETLVSIKSDTLDPVFSIEGDGDMHLSGNITIKGNPNTDDAPMIHFSSSINDDVKAHIGINNAGNILIQNNTNNKHIVFKAKDNSVIKEGLRLDGAVPEVVVNQTPSSLVNFRVESENNDHMLYVTGSDQVGIGVSDPAPEVTLDISGSAIRLRNSSTPASAGSPGSQGEIRWDANYIYICISTDTWKRVAISTW